jgi:predicted lactoylglutathione lyase
MKLTYVILYVESIKKSLSFYQEALGLKVRFTHESGDYAEMDTGETVLALCNHQLADSILKQDYHRSGVSKKLLGSQITFSPENINSAYENAISNGATKIAAPEIKPWNFEVAIVKDIDGHIIEFAKDLN